MGCSISIQRVSTISISNFMSCGLESLWSPSLINVRLTFSLTKEFNKVEWTEIDNDSKTKTEDKSQAIIQ